MDAIKNKTTVVGIVTLIVGLALGLGIGVWGINTTRASTSKSASQAGPRTEQKEPLVLRDAGDPFRQMEQMQEEINQVIRRATGRFQFGSGASLLRPDAGYSSSFDLRDRKDRFELRAYLPDAEASDVSVKIDDDRVLHLTVGHKKQELKKEDTAEARVTELGRYEQVITLPEPVKGADMKIDRNGHEVVITIPKAKNA